MSSYLRWIIPIAVVATLTYLSWGFTNRLRQKDATASRIASLPAVSITDLNGQPIQLATNNRPLVLVYIDPDCDHCVLETKELRAHNSDLRGATVWLVSTAPLDKIRTFARAQQLSTESSLQLAQISSRDVHETFGFASTPEILIYNAQGALAKHFRGQTSVAAIVNHLK